MESLPSQLLCPFVVPRLPDHPVVLLAEGLQRFESILVAHRVPEENRVRILRTPPALLPFRS